MKCSKRLVCGAILILAALCISAARGADAPKGGPGKGGAARPLKPGEEMREMRDLVKEGKVDPEEVRKRMEEWRARRVDQLRPILKIQSDEEWEIIRAKLNEIDRLDDVDRMRRLGGRLGPEAARLRKADPEQFDQRMKVFLADKPELEPLYNAEVALADLLAKGNALDEEIKEKLAAVNKARADFEAKLKKAKDELQQILDTRQQAILTLAGYLD